MSAQHTGWIPPQDRTPEQVELDELVQSTMPKFSLPVRDEGRYPLWRLAQKGLGGPLQYAHQTTGSCFPAGTLVRMADGSEKPVETVAVDDEVVTHVGGRRRVVETMRRLYTGQMVTLHVRGFAFPLTMTADHQVAVMRGERWGQWQPDHLEWVRADEIEAGDRVVLGWDRSPGRFTSVDVAKTIGEGAVRLDDVMNGTEHRLRCPDAAARQIEASGVDWRGRVKVGKGRTDGAIYDQVAVTESFARFVGLYLAEGGVDSGRVTFTYSSAERDTLAAETLVLVRGLFGVDGTLSHEPEKGRTTIRVGSTALAAFLESLVPGNVYTKRVPGLFFSAGETVRAALVGGWMAGDGYYRPGNSERDGKIQGVSASAGLARDMTTLALSVGYRASCSRRKPRGRSREAWDVYLSGPGARAAVAAAKGVAPDTHTTRGKSDSARCDYGYCRPVRRVEYSAVEALPVYDFEVEEDHSFIAGGLVVHNCVGAAGYSAMLTLMGVEIALGEAEEFQQIFWPWTYGQSRRLGGLRGRGEGSFGSAYFKAVRECGHLAVRDGEKLNLPKFRTVSGWLQLDREGELRFSDGAAFAGAPYDELGRKHLVNTGSRATTVQALLGLLQSGYPCTIASMFGTRTITPRGNGENRVNIAQWDDRWAHQMFIDEAWKNPELGWVFRIGNNWGPHVHPAPANDSPVGGFYMDERTMARVLAARETEVFGLGGLSGFPVRQIDWYI